jgi:hypothetical protein
MKAKLFLALSLGIVLSVNGQVFNEETSLDEFEGR